jgi:outer membrane protein TolC
LNLFIFNVFYDAHYKRLAIFAKQMKKQNIIFMALWIATSVAGQTDSLNRYLETAARRNPSVKAAFHTYEASLQKAPQAGAYQDPQLEMGFFLKPMNIVDGRQIAQFQLMQMFPWFGVRKAARTEAQHEAAMAFAQFREARDKLYLEVYTQWNVLCGLQQRLINNRENQTLLQQLERLALQKFTSPTGSTNASPAAARNGDMGGASPSGSAGMDGMTAAPRAQKADAASTSGNATSMGGAGGSLSSGMAEVLRIQLERVELESDIESVLSEIIAGKALFNALLHRPPEAEVMIPDALVQIPFFLDMATATRLIADQNPMLGMLDEEKAAYTAKAEMDRKMGYPMFGIGLQYTLIGKNGGSMGAAGSMDGKDMVMPMMSVSIPIYRNKYKAARQESELLRQASEEKYADTFNRLQAELYQSQHLLDDASRKIARYQKQAALTQTTYNLMVQEFTSGKSGLGEIIELQRRLLNYRIKEAEAIAAYNTMAANIRKMISSKQSANF